MCVCIYQSNRSADIDVFESAENIEQPAEVVNEPAMIPVSLHLLDKENWRHKPMILFLSVVM